METSCKIEGCKRPYRAKGYCGTHYKRWRAGELPKPRFKICSGEECQKPMIERGRGLCQEHYDEWLAKRKKEEPKVEEKKEEAVEAKPAETKPPK